MSKDKARKENLIIFISLMFIIFFKFIPAPSGLSTSAMQVLGTFIGVLILWLTVAIDWPSLLALAALAFIPEISFDSILSSSIGGSTFSFLMFTFICTYAISQTTFVRRCALLFINSGIAQKGPWAFTMLFFISALVLGSFMSPTVLFVIYLPIIEEIFEVLQFDKKDKFANMLMMGMAICISISSGMTPIAHVFSNMAMGFYETATGNTISYLNYIIFGTVVGILTFIAMMLIFRFILRPDVSIFHRNEDFKLKEDVEPMNKREKVVLFIFGVVIFLWVAPGILEFILPDIAAYINSYGTAFPPLLGAIALFILKIDGEPLLDFREAMSKGVAWSSLIMAASTLALGAVMTNEEIGLTDWVSSAIAPKLGGLGLIPLVFVFTLWAALQTNLSSNMVTITVVSAVALPISIATDGLISTPAIASIIGMMGAFAFVTPPSHPNIALAISSGWTDSKQMLIYGGLTMVASILITTFIGYPIAAALMGI